MVEPGQLIGGKYLLARPLAQGGMGELWVGHHVELDILVAVKFLEQKLAAEPEFVRRFQREARAAARLRSAHVARIHDYGVERGASYIVMELLEGETLADCLARSGQLPLARVAGIVSQLAKGLAEAHQAGIVHRDLKPSNVFLARVAGEEVVKILDFGIAKELYGQARDAAVTDSGVLLGSPRYMSPEQARGNAVDHRTDLWSLGVLVFEALTGKPLFESNHQGNLIAAITGDPLPTASELRPDLPPAIDRFFERALARNPAGRFKQVAALAEELRAVAEGRPPMTEVPTAAMQDFDAPPASVEPAGRSSVTVDVGPAARASRPPGVDSGVASTIRRPRTRRVWYAGALALAAAAGAFALLRRDAAVATAARSDLVQAAAVERVVVAPAPVPPPAVSSVPPARPRVAPRPIASSQPPPKPSRDPNFGLPVKPRP